MDLDGQISEADGKIRGEYLWLVVKHYAPIFEEIQTRADKHMKDEGFASIQLSPGGLEYASDSVFRFEGHEVALDKLPKIYQDYSDNMAGQADSRGHRTPSVHDAMRDAAKDFRSRVKASLASVL